MRVMLGAHGRGRRVEIVSEEPDFYDVVFLLPGKGPPEVFSNGGLYQRMGVRVV